VENKKPLVYALVLIVVIVIVVVMAGGKGDEKKGLGEGGSATFTQGEEYSAWADEVAKQLENMTGSGPFKKLKITDPEAGTFEMDPYEGLEVHGVGTVTSVNVRSNGAWDLKVDADPGGEAEVTMNVPMRFAQGDAPAEGQEVAFYGIVEEWECTKGAKPLVKLHDGKIKIRK